MKNKFIEKSDCYKYELRSCIDCKKFNHCLNATIQWEKRFFWLDLAKCGCNDYRNNDAKIMAEKPKKINLKYE